MACVERMVLRFTLVLLMTVAAFVGCKPKPSPSETANSESKQDQDNQTLENPASLQPETLARRASADREAATSDLTGGRTPQYVGDDNAPLLRALDQGDIAGAVILLLAGANPNVGTSDGLMAIMVASALGDLNLLRLMIEKGADLNVKYTQASPADGTQVVNTALTYAIHANHTAVVSFLIVHGMDVGYSGGGGWSPLTLAVHRNCGPIVSLLLRKGAAFNEQDGTGTTPLEWAFEDANTEMIEVLLGVGATANADSRKGGTLLEQFARYPERSWRRTVRYLLEHDHRLTRVTKERACVAATACDTCDLSVFLENGVSAGARGRRGRTALEAAIIYGNVAAIDVLVQHRAPITDDALIYASLHLDAFGRVTEWRPKILVALRKHPDWRR